MKANSKNQRSQSRDRAGFTIIELLVVISIIGLLAALLLPSRRGARGAARRSHCRNNLKQIGLALHNYHSYYGCFPPAYTMGPDRQPLHSWRTLLLPYLDQQDLYDQIDLSKPWEDPANAEIFAKYEGSVRVYQCPSSTAPTNHTTYLAVLGEQNAFHSDRPRKISEFADGVMNTVMVVEVAPERAVPWMAPVDTDGTYLVNLTEDSPVSHQSGGHGLFADGSVQFLSHEVSSAERSAMVTIAGDDDALE